MQTNVNGGGVVDLETAVARVWTKVLGVDHVGPTDNFFALGGNSLLAARIIFELETLFKQPVPLAPFLTATTIHELVTRLRDVGWPAERTK